ncbi:unnamed protein product [Linum trigynum]|uniref:Uncharacterized protein n=1 Tax=Linum trigynum TaxID=586398 RepID=A0AAV2E7E6_9ROSI
MGEGSKLRRRLRQVGQRVEKRALSDSSPRWCLPAQSSVESLRLPNPPPYPRQPAWPSPCCRATEPFAMQS